MFLAISDRFPQAEAVPPAALFHYNTLHHQHQLAPVQLSARSVGFGQREGSALQPFIVQHKPTVLPMKQLHVRAAPVQKDEHVTTGGTPSEAAGDQTAESVK